jgi:hypothetical protein
MWRTCVVVALLCLVTGMAAAQENQGNRRGDCDYWCQIFGGDDALRRMGPPSRPSDYYIPRSVGAWSQVNDMTVGGQPWWQLTTGRPFYETVLQMDREHGLSAIGFGLRAHPTDNVEAYNGCGELLPDASPNSEAIRPAFRHPGMDIIVLWLSHWGTTEMSCDGQSYIAWQEYPLDVYGWLYRYYGNQDKAVILMSYESDNRLHGKGCHDRDECSWYDLAGCVERCEAGTWMVNDWYPEGYVRPDDCLSVCCDQDKLARRHRMLRIFNERQAAAEAARWKYRHAKLRVYHAIEVDRYDREGLWLTTARDVIPYMQKPPDFVGLSCWPAKCGETTSEVIESFNRVMEWTGLPVYRMFVAEVGAREFTPGDQYNRIMTVVPPLFDRGAAFALVWSLEQSSEKQMTLHALIDPETGEYRSGMDAIQELNEIYAE